MRHSTSRGFCWCVLCARRLLEFAPGANMPTALSPLCWTDRWNNPFARGDTFSIQTRQQPGNDMVHNTNGQSKHDIPGTYHSCSLPIRQTRSCSRGRHQMPQCDYHLPTVMHWSDHEYHSNLLCHSRPWRETQTVAPSYTTPVDLVVTTTTL
jgi:hypothetical protein